MLRLGPDGEPAAAPPRCDICLGDNRAIVIRNRLTLVPVREDVDPHEIWQRCPILSGYHTQGWRNEDADESPFVQRVVDSVNWPEDRSSIEAVIHRRQPMAARRRPIPRQVRAPLRASRQTANTLPDVSTHLRPRLHSPDQNSIAVAIHDAFILEPYGTCSIPTATAADQMLTGNANWAGTDKTHSCLTENAN